PNCSERDHPESMAEVVKIASEEANQVHHRNTADVVAMTGGDRETSGCLQPRWLRSDDLCSAQQHAHERHEQFKNGDFEIGEGAHPGRLNPRSGRTVGRYNKTGLCRPCSLNSLSSLCHCWRTNRRNPASP